MYAKEARLLRVGDWVTATFGGRGVRKACEIIAIDWPRFTLRTTDYNGEEMIRFRNYGSLRGRCSPQRPSVVTSPSWLIWPSEK